jgi:hypothetical protein
MVGLGTWYFVFLEREKDCNQKWPKVTNGKITIRKANRMRRLFIMPAIKL